MIAMLSQPRNKHKQKVGRPKGSNAPRTLTFKFSTDAGVDASSDLANTKQHSWQWDASEYPEAKRSQGPSQTDLERHAPPLAVLMSLAPNGYPDGYGLATVLGKLHSLFGIFNDCNNEGMTLYSKALYAAARWRIMAKHLLMLSHSNAPIHSPILKALVDQVRP